MKKILHNTRKKGHHKLPLRKNGNQPYIGVIETTMMYYSTENSKEHLISVRIKLSFPLFCACLL